MEKDKNTLIWILITIIVVLFLVGGFGMGSYGMMGFGSIFMLLFWALIIWLIIWAIKRLSGKDETPLETLEKRYAKGEITKKQFQEMKKDLKR